MTDFLAATTWETIELEAVWESLNQSLVHLDTLSQIQLAGQAIGHLVALFVASSYQVFDELDATVTEEGPAMTIEEFLPFVRQSMEIDFTQFVGGFDRDGLRGTYAPRQAESDSLPSELHSIAAIVDSRELADAVGVEKAVEEEMGLEAALALAHREDVAAWSDAISAYFDRAGVGTVSLCTLQRSLALPWIEVWLGLLLGGYELEQRGSDFYAGEIWVRDRLRYGAARTPLSSY